MQEELVVLKGVTESRDGIRETQLRRTYSLVTKHNNTELAEFQNL